MTERGAGQVQRERSDLRIGPSTLSWKGDAMHIAVEEICAPIPRRLRGSIRVIPKALVDRSFALDAAGLHHWSPIAPCARIEVQMSEPALTWSGNGYVDSNLGVVPLEDTFENWSWSRASRDDHTAVLYDVSARDAEPQSMALQFDSKGTVLDREVPPLATLPTTGWRIPRQTRADSGDVRLVKTLEDGPFYSRSLLSTRIAGAAAPAIHESLSLNRFRSLWVQCLLPFRMPRTGR
jgi:carotenoid 1,2-hydratase